MAADRSGEELPADLEIVGGDSVVVEALVPAGRGADARDAIRAAGGDVNGAVPGELIQAAVPVASLVELERSGAISSLRPPLDYNQPDEREAGFELAPPPEKRSGSFVGAEVTKTGANLWHAAGITGAGVKIGIIDSFNLGFYNAAVAAGEIPAPTGTICRDNGAMCSIFSSTSKHGTGVTEIVADMAPGAQIYLASATTAADSQAAVNFFAAQGVDVITRSETGRFDGPGNGTGPIDAVIDSAIAQGMTYVNSGGNAAGRNGAQGGYWRGQWSDPNGNGVLNFSGTDEFLKYDCSYVSGVRWSDWGEGSAMTDYDVQVYSGPSTASTLLDAGIDGQGGGSTNPPLELATTCGATGGDAYLHIERFDTHGGDTADTLEFKTNGIGVEHFSNPFSAGGPMADSANPGMLSVGAIDPALGVTIGSYSAEGPTNDGRLKPDLSAASCVASFTYSPACFNGTSAAAPVVAGAAALILSGGRATTPQEVKSYLTNAVTDRGSRRSRSDLRDGRADAPRPRQRPTDGRRHGKRRARPASGSRSATPWPTEAVRPRRRSRCSTARARRRRPSPFPSARRPETSAR